MSKSLPDGWKIVSLHFAEGEPQVGPRPSDSQIARANSIRVSYTPRGESEPVAYRTIHGAPDRKTIGDIIVRVIRIGSPVGRRR